MFTPRNWCLLGVGALLGTVLLLRLAWPPDAIPTGAAVPMPPAPETAVSPGADDSPNGILAVVQEPPVSPSPALPEPDAEEEATTLARIADQLAHPDPFTVRHLASHLQHPSAAVRAAVRDALRVTGDPAALPDLQLALEAATEADEAVELADLIAYLRLPSYTELRERDQSRRHPGAQRARVAAGVPVQTTPSSTTAPGAANPDALAALRAENERLRAENERLRARVGLAATP